MAIFGTLKENDLSAISASKSDTAVDVFVYDTTKDSDGGAWRKRTQNTSWYNETLNTTTRGSRKEFPAVAVIVAESNPNKVTIYDGDDPDLPMWMVFNLSGAVGANSNMLPRGNSPSESDITSIACLNGRLAVGLKDVNGTVGEGLAVIDFISELARIHRGGASGYTGAIYSLPISGRNSNGLYRGDYNSLAIVAETCNDVAMTVLPNAPIDDTTGLPIPTIAVATDGGPSIIKDDGFVVSYTRGGNEYTGTVAFDENNDLIISWGTTLGGYRHATRITNPFVGTTTLDTTYGYIASDTGLGGSAAGNTNGVVTVANSGKHFGIDFDSSSGVPANQGNHDDRVDFLHINDVDTTKSLVAFATTSYNTGWMHGNIKLATLSYNDPTSTYGSELITNGTFVSNIDGWTAYNSVLSHQTDAIRVADNGSWSKAYQAFTTVVSKVYLVKVVVKTISGGLAGAFAGAQNPAQLAGNDTQVVSFTSNTGTYYGLFTATATTSYIEVTSDGSSYVDYSEISVKEHDPSFLDRSIINNGLIEYGTVTKSAVATGADLVAYSGYSANNVLVQPYNSNLDPGTGDYSFTFWFKCPATTAEQQYMRRFGVPTTTAGMMMRLVASTSVLQWYVRDTSSSVATVQSTSAVDDDVWHFAVGTRQGSVANLYLDGVLVNTSACSANSHDPGDTADLVIGAEESAVSPGTYQNPADLSSMALMRYSLSVPSPEQIKKMYADEKVLFQENSQATLHGSSDAVTALGYDDDTDILHVGTSSGRSDFQGLRRINNTTTAVTTAISAHDTFIIEQ